MTLKAKMMITLGLLAAAVVSAAPVPCGAPPPPAQVVDTFPPAGASAFTYTCGGLTFSNFQVIDAGATLPITVNLVGATHDDETGMVVLNFNPNMFAGIGLVQDINFYFQVDGGINGIDLAVGGTNSSITERACSTPIDVFAGNNCTGGLANQLAALTNFSGNSPIVSMFANGMQRSPVYIFKDIMVSGRNTQGGAELTSFSQSFHTAVPEPLTSGLMGLGLLGLGLMRKRKSA
jgi:hypothetical protein